MFWSQEAQLSKHEQKHAQQHKKGISFKCTICGKLLAARESLISHMKTQHNKEFPPDVRGKAKEEETFKCLHCKKGFSHARTLRIHALKVHGKDERSDADVTSLGPRLIEPEPSSHATIASISTLSFRPVPLPGWSLSDRPAGNEQGPLAPGPLIYSLLGGCGGAEDAGSSDVGTNSKTPCPNLTSSSIPNVLDLSQWSLPLFR